MEMLFGAFVFVFGTLIGSFLNVIILRHNTGLGVRGRSKCFSCGTTLHWHELMPVVSFVVQGGKCRTCKSSISCQYPLVEAATGAIFWLIAQSFLPITPENLPILFFAWLVASLFIVISVYDLRHTIIPDEHVGALISLGLIVALSTERRWETIGVAIVLAGFFAAIWHFSRGRAMGLGDAKLTLAIGLFFSPMQSFTAVALAVWIAAAVGIGLLIGRWKKVTLTSEIPFGPFLAIGALVVYVINFSLI